MESDLKAFRPRILFVYGAGGPSIEYALPRLSKHAELSTLLLTPPSQTGKDWIAAHSISIDNYADCMEHSFSVVAERIARVAEHRGVTAIITLSEFAVELVAAAAAMLDMLGAGSNVMRARNKVAMRRRWKEVGVPIPRFLSATDEESLFEAVERLRLPVVVKLADGAGSIGHTIINQKDEVPSALAKLNRARSIATAKGTSPYYKSEYTEFIVEELIQASTHGWYRESGYGDYLSVEGLVVNGTYRPIVISGRFPSIPPFTELGNHTPVPIEAERIAIIEHEARRAVDALQLNFCATHTEMKLCQDGTVCLLESAARLAGAAVIPMVEAAYGIDLIGMWVRVLTDQALEFPNHLLGLRDARCAAANIPIISVNFDAKPWGSSQRFWHDIDWSPLVSNETKVQISQGQTVPSGTLIEPYDSAIGVLNYAGRLLVTANDPITLKKDAMSLINGMESLLAAESTRRLANDFS